MPDSDVYAVKRFPVFIVFALVDDGIYGDGGFTHLTVADDELALAATYGYHRVDGFDTGLQGLFYRLAEDNAGGFAVEGHEDGVAGNGPCAVDGFAQRVDDTTEQPFAYGDRGDVAGAASCQWMTNGLIALAVLLTALTLAILCWISIGLRSALNGMERLAAGERGVHVALGGGDELASLADDVNALSDALQDVDRQQNELAQSYRRFVPERVLSLLGKTSILEVDKQTFVSRDLAAMMLRFQFPDQVYEKSGRELFDNINEILECTASIVTQKGGAVFNFAYNGYDAVFEGGSAAAVSTAVAVQQEILDLNREREVEGRAPVAVHIALDEGNVMLGVVGDENQIEPTSISSSFSVVKHLVDLCGRLEANILCTEAVMNGARGYGSRYMGKCREGGAYIRTYEIFDGDPYDIRKVKEATGERFSQGVYALYSRDFSQAKGIFLSLVHHNTGDGGARYYLYLADQLEKRPEAEISLD